MSEITKLYENAGIEPEINYVCDKEPCEQHSVDCQKCSHLYDTREDYPDFTAEKQIELIKWCLDNYRGYIFDSIETEWFEEQLCAFINNIWQDLTEEEKQQVKGILE